MQLRSWGLGPLRDHYLHNTSQQNKQAPSRSRIHQQAAENLTVTVILSTNPARLNLRFCAMFVRKWKNIKDIKFNA
jgi:hypothetical protein